MWLGAKREPRPNQEKNNYFIIFIIALKNYDPWLWEQIRDQKLLRAWLKDKMWKFSEIDKK